MYVFLVSLFALDFSRTWIQGHRIIPGLSRYFPIHHKVRFLLFVFHNFGNLINSGDSDQDSHPSRRGRKPPRMHVMPRNGDVQVTITKTIEFDVELHLGERGPAKQSRGDEESVLESRELTKEEQHMRSLERQLKHDLEI
jgi:hypothetical protein